MVLVIIIVSLVVVGLVAWFLWGASGNTVVKPPHFKEPIALGRYRVVAFDEMGGAELSRVIGDFDSFEEAQAEASRNRADSVLQGGKKGNPTKFFIYDSKEIFVGDWTGRRS